MREVTFNGPQKGLRLPSGRIIRRGRRSEVTDDDLEFIEQSRLDVTVHRPKSDGD